MIKHANHIYENHEKWIEMVKNSMKEDFSWDKSVEKYIDLYKELSQEAD